MTMLPDRMTQGGGKVLILILAALLGGCEKKAVPLLPALIDPTTVGPLEQKVLLVAGQSNMLGHGPASLGQFLPTYYRVECYGCYPSGPGYWAAMSLVEQHPTWKITVINVSVGGTPISEWLPGTANHTRAIDKIRTQQSQGKELIGILFYQGESDARANLNLDWDKDFAAVVNAWKSALGSVPVVFAQIATLGGPDYQTEWNTFKKIQESIAMSGVSMVVTDDSTRTDHVHIDLHSCMRVGERMASHL